MEGKKALVISIGTGTRPGTEAVESLVNGIIYSIESNNPEKVFLVVSKESQELTLPGIIQRINTAYKIIPIEDPDDIQKIYGNLFPEFREVKRNFERLAIDYTSGTKAMTSALAILGTLFEADTLSYVAGKRSGGIVLKGTEKLYTVRPYFAIFEERMKSAIRFFNECRFDTSLAIIADIESATSDSELLSRLAPLKKAALAYSAWDKFAHQIAFACLKEVKMPSFDRNKAFLGELLSHEEKEPYWIADLINNAKRRGEIENKYDDATARLYRVIELIAQYELKKCGIQGTSDVNIDEIPQELKIKWNIAPGRKIQLGLEKDYELLANKGKEIGGRFIEDKELRNWLSRRNSSILAHGIEPVSKETYHNLFDKAISYASASIAKLEKPLSNSAFVKWDTRDLEAKSS